MTSDGVPIDFHAVITYQVTDRVRLVRDFGADVGDRGVPGVRIRISTSRFEPPHATRSGNTA